MSWEAWTAIGQLIGAAGVIASLVFVGVQVRQSVRATKANAFQGLASTIITLNMSHIDNPYLTSIINRAAKGEALTPSEHQQYVALILSGIRLAQSAHYQAQLGLLDEAKLESVVYNLVRHLKSETGRTVWAELEKRSDAEFRDYIATLLERSDTYESLLTPQGGRPMTVDA